MALHDVIRRLQDSERPESSQSTLLQWVSPIMVALGWDMFDPRQVDLSTEEITDGVSKTSVFLSAEQERTRVRMEMDVIFGQMPPREPGSLRDWWWEWSEAKSTAIGVVTDGMQWRIYGGWDERRSQPWLLDELDIEDEESDDQADILEKYLSKSRLHEGSVTQTVERRADRLQTDDLLRGELPRVWHDLLSEPDQMLAEILQEAAQQTLDRKIDIGSIEDFLRALVDEDSSDSRDDSGAMLRCRQPMEVTGTTPTVVHIFGKAVQVGTWLDVFATVVTAVYERHIDTFDQARKLQGRTVQYIAHKDDLADLSPEKRRRYMQIGTTSYWFHKNASADQFNQRCRGLLHSFGYNEWSAEIYCVELWGVSYEYGSENPEAF